MNPPKLRRKPRKLEHQAQSALFTWATLNQARYPQLGLMFAIPNGGLRNKAVAAQLKREGLKPGVPDVFLAHPCQGFNGLFIEMKKATGGRVSPYQQDWIGLLRLAGYKVAVCEGSEEAIKTVCQYLNIKQ